MRVLIFSLIVASLMFPNYLSAEPLSPSLNIETQESSKFWQTEQGEMIKYPSSKDTIACNLSHAVHNVYNKGKIRNAAKRERAPFATVFTDLTSDEPKTLAPHESTLIKISEHNGAYWLLEKTGTAVVLLLVDTVENVFVQTRIMNLMGKSVSTSWMGRCL